MQGNEFTGGEIIFGNMNTFTKANIPLLNRYINDERERFADEAYRNYPAVYYEFDAEGFDNMPHPCGVNVSITNDDIVSVMDNLDEYAPVTGLRGENISDYFDISPEDVQVLQKTFWLSDKVKDIYRNAIRLASDRRIGELITSGAIRDIFENSSSIEDRAYDLLNGECWKGETDYAYSF